MQRFLRAIICFVLSIVGIVGFFISVLVPFLTVSKFNKFLRAHFGSGGIFHIITYRLCIFLQVPQGLKLLQVYEAMVNRDSRKSDFTLTYIERVVDRVINKARGMLTFNSGLIALSGALIKLGPPGNGGMPERPVLTALQYIVLLDLCVSSILMLELFVARWNDPAVYGTYEAELLHSVRALRDRSMVVNFSIFLSAICVVGLLDIVVPRPLSAYIVRA